MFKKIYEINYLNKIRAAMAETTPSKWLKLNTYKQQAAHDVIKGRISEKFYKEIFCGGDFYHHYTEVNAETIKNYKI